MPEPRPINIPPGAYAVIDGDTIDVVDTVDGESLRVRIIGYDTPELHGECEAERVAARVETQALELHLASGCFSAVINAERPEDRFGHILARVYVEETDVAALMIDGGHGRPYYGGRRQV